MEVLLTFAGSVHEDTDSLLGWLSENPELAGKVRPTSSSAIEGAQGPGTDAIAVALGGSGTLTTLALCLKTWIQAYYAQRSKHVHLEINGADGKKAVIDASNAEDAEAILRQLMKDGQPD